MVFKMFPYIVSIIGLWVCYLGAITPNTLLCSLGAIIVIICCSTEPKKKEEK